MTEGQNKGRTKYWEIISKYAHPPRLPNGKWKVGKRKSGPKFNFGGKLGIDLLWEDDGVYNMDGWLENMLIFIKLLLIFLF
jgi:hypothetical protein